MNEWMKLRDVPWYGIMAFKTITDLTAQARQHRL